METITAFDAKTHFGALLDRVSRGEEIVITRHDKAVARIVPEGTASLESVREAVFGLHALRERMAARADFQPLTDAEIKEMINEGRR